jgi:cytochrome c oxidase subunit 1
MNLVFFPMHMIGMNGMPRRVHDYTQYDIYSKFLHLNQFMTICALILGLSQVIVIVNFIGSLFWGKKAPQNPWHANSLEWVAAPTPPPHGNFLTVPVVHHGPYEYSSPLVAEDYLPQTLYVEGAEKLAHLGH